MCFSWLGLYNWKTPVSVTFDEFPLPRSGEEPNRTNDNMHATGFW